MDRTVSSPSSQPTEAVRPPRRPGALTLGLIMGVAFTLLLQMVLRRGSPALAVAGPEAGWSVAPAVQELSLLESLRELERRALTLQPLAANVAALERWQENARRLVTEVERVERMLPSLRARGEALPTELVTPARRRAREQLESVQADLDHAERLANNPAASDEDLAHHSRLQLLMRELRQETVDVEWSFADPRDAWTHGVIQEIVTVGNRLRVPQTGIITDVERRLRLARGMERRTQNQENEWARRLPELRASELYSDLPEVAHPDLLPLGPDPSTGLWEFAHLPSGEAPQRDPTTGQLVLSAASSVVLVLFPAGSFWMGSQAEHPKRRHYQLGAEEWEGPVRKVHLEAFLLARDEISQAHWLRLTGNNPAAGGLRQRTAGGTHEAPVTDVTFEDVESELLPFDLTLPTEAQWEFAARRIREAHISGVKRAALPLQNIGCGVEEWCRDPFGSYLDPVRPADGKRLAGVMRLHAAQRVVRDVETRPVRLTARRAVTVGFSSPKIGLRPARLWSPGERAASD